VCLDREALSVLAIDVGYGQLAWKLRTDDRVLVVERTNIRHVVVDDMPFKPDVIVSDLSFISLTIVVEKFREMSHESTDWLLMVKPQFEVGKDLIGDGVVRDAGLRGGAVEKVALSIQELGVGIVAIAPSPLPGPEGNVEYFIWAKCGAPLVDSEHLNRLIFEAIEKGPQ
jgi:23S rRNA (cytidine1920-2'-O)/16S rRNA (cytidine1409-2'-O)-methyltransferase